MKQHKIDQNTDAWMELRAGKFTASMFKDLFSKESSAAYRNAIYKAVFEKVTGELPESFTNDYMTRGHELEPVAREVYEMETFNTVEDAGFFELNEWVGASPDGLINDDGIVEIKCPSYAVMIQYLIDQKLPNIYKYQVHGQLWVTGRKWCDFMSYHPQLKSVIIRIHRDEEIIAELESKVSECIEKAKLIIEKIK